MMPVKSFEMPSRVILDSQSGYAVNIPLHYQFRFKIDVNSELLARIMAKRKELGIEIVDWLPYELVENKT